MSARSLEPLLEDLEFGGKGLDESTISGQGNTPTRTIHEQSGLTPTDLRSHSRLTHLTRIPAGILAALDRSSESTYCGENSFQKGGRKTRGSPIESPALAPLLLLTLPAP